MAGVYRPEHYWNALPSGGGRNEALSDLYSRDLRREGSFAAGVLGIPDRIKLVSAYTAAGNMAKAKEEYDQIVGFYGDHAAEMADAVSIQSRGDAFLEAVKQGALLGYNRRFDSHVVQTPSGPAPLGDIFGEDGQYQKMQTKGLQAQYFSKSVIDAINGDDEDRKSVISTLTDPVMGVVRPGEKTAPRSQYGMLAHEVATSWDANVAAVGVDGIRTAVSLVRDRHLDAGTADSLYRFAMAGAAARLQAGSETDPVKAVRGVLDSYDSLAKRYVGDGRGGIPASASRMLATMVTGAASADPGLDLSDPFVQNGLGELLDLFAMDYRAGGNLMQQIQNESGGFSKAVAGYVTARGQGLPPPADNLLTKLVQAHDRIAHNLTSGWRPASTEARANPELGAGSAAAVLRATSSVPGLDYATVRTGEAIFGMVARLMNQTQCTEPEAYAGVVGSENGTFESRLSEVLSDAMIVSEPAARGIAGALRMRMQNATARPAGLEQAVADFAFGGNRFDSREVQDARADARKWYAANLGPGAPAFDELIDRSGWNAVLQDDLVGFGTDREGVARAEAMRQFAKRKMAQLAESGLPAEALMEDLKDLGQYYYVSGYRDVSTGEIVDGVPEDIRKAMTAKDPRVVARLARKYAPVVARGQGNLNSVEQPIQNWHPEGLGVIPYIPKGAWTERPHEFRNAMEQLRNIYRNDQKAMNKVLADQAAALANEEFGR